MAKRSSHPPLQLTVDRDNGTCPVSKDLVWGWAADLRRPVQVRRGDAGILGVMWSRMGGCRTLSQPIWSGSALSN